MRSGRIPIEARLFRIRVKPNRVDDIQLPA